MFSEQELEERNERTSMQADRFPVNEAMLVNLSRNKNSSKQLEQSAPQVLLHQRSHPLRKQDILPSDLKRRRCPAQRARV